MPMSSSGHGAGWVVDALGGAGDFVHTKSVKGWTLRGGTELVENDDGDIVLQLYSTSERSAAYAVQAKYPAKGPFVQDKRQRLSL